MWDSLFGIANAWAMLCWAVLVLAPRTPLAQTAVFYAGAGLLCLVYAVLLVLLLTGALDADGAGDGGASLTSIAGVRAIFASDGGVVVGWVHYLAFDLFTGLWIARDADNKCFSQVVQAPVLLLTFLFGPAGLLAWMAIREKRARKGAKSSIRIKR